MSALLARLASGVRVRIAFAVAIVGLAVVVAMAAVAWRLGGTMPALVVVAIAAAAVAVMAWQQTRCIDQGWVASRLDDLRRDLDDSVALLSAEASTLGPLQRLQRERIEQRLRAQPVAGLRPRWPFRAIAIAWLLALLAVAWVIAWPRASMPPESANSAPVSPGDTALSPKLVASSLRVQPPAYTGIATGDSDRLDAKAPAGSRLHWTVRFDPQPVAVALVTHVGRRVALRRAGDDWSATMQLDASMLYRIVVEGEAGQGRLYRIDAVPDQLPRIRVRIPERGLTLADPVPRGWPLSFEAEDDHGLAPEARLVILRTEGSGENIRFHEHVRVLRGRGEPRRLRFDTSLVPADFGLQRGEDLIARLEVRDNRVPSPQSTRSASVILRWPEQVVLGAEGLEGLARQVLPAYFRSQRQIIIDAEALLKEKPRLAAGTFEERSDAIGVDQRLLRLRYGQFLGEESEGGAQSLPTSDLPTNDTVDDDEHDHDHDGTDHAEADAGDHGHDHDAGPATSSEGFGDEAGILEAYGHIHDLPEAATLLDPKTRDILRKALREMWQSELHLRQANPQDALPYAYRALEFIKQVQQADRIYLQRVGSQLPPIDEGRRLGGKRDGIAPGRLPAAPSHAPDPLQPLWLSLSAGEMLTPATLDSLQAWVAGNPARVTDPLAIVVAIDALRLDPGCVACRDDLRGQLWAAMRRPDGGVSPRASGDDSGKRYLELLRRQEAPR